MKDQLIGSQFMRLREKLQNVHSIIKLGQRSFENI